MKVSSVFGFVLTVKNLDKTVKFYDQLGFRFGRREDNRLAVYANWFSIDFVTSEDSKLDHTGEGVSFMISVEC